MNKIIKTTTNILTILSLAVLPFSCKGQQQRQSEGSGKLGENVKNTVTAVVETTPTPRKTDDDSADDPAIWIDSTDVAQSFVIGTDKKGGIATYDLNGKQLNYYPDGKLNNCDLRYGFVLNNEKIDVLAASNRSSHSISLYRVEKGGKLTAIHAGVIKSHMKKNVYGACMYQSHISGKYFVFVNSKLGEVEQWQLFAKKNKIDAKLVRTLQLPSKIEGMVADDNAGYLYIAEENAGIHKVDAEPSQKCKDLVIANSSESNNENIKYDIEGLTIYPTDSVNGYLLASSQGNYTYAVYERQGNNKYLGSFRVVDGTVDGTDETDGIDATNVPLGEKYPKGMLVVQDGFNYDNGKLVSQDYKYISWEDIEKLFKK